MTNLYIPKNICPKCKKEIWDYDEDKDSVICKKYNLRTKKNTGCGEEIKKKLHNLIGASISKNEKGQYVLAFPEYKETNIYPDWETLQSEMDKLAKYDEVMKTKDKDKSVRKYGKYTFDKNKDDDIAIIDDVKGIINREEIKMNEVTKCN